MSKGRVTFSWEVTLPILLLVLAGMLFALQLRSLFIFPQPNSIRWFGDETWLMSEARQQIATGVVTYPLAVGSQLAHGKGLVLSLTWFSSLLYGLPALIFGGDSVMMGRCVTAGLAIALLIALYVCSRALGASRSAASLAVLLLISTRAFFFASHSARPDLLAGLIVLCVLAFMVHTSSSGVQRKSAWWFWYGTIVLFLALSSSIHLVTLLIPAAIYFYWQMSTGQHGRALVRSATGAIVVLAILSTVYYFTTGSLSLFPPSARTGQFHDVLTAIPILRPFSRSVQVANIIIRVKQFVADAPEIFLLSILLPFVWRLKLKHILAVATSIVVLSWLLLQGAEVNYLIHILPLLFLCLAIAISRFVNRWNYSIWAFTVIGVLAFLFSVRDSNSALANGTVISQSNQLATGVIERQIESTWDKSGKPLVLTEPPMLDRLSQDTLLRVMTDHFISFPEQDEPFDSFFAREHVNYAVLYNSRVYPKNRPMEDPFYQSVERAGNVIERYVGTSGDIGRSYFQAFTWMDTVLIFKLNPTAP